MTQVKNQTWTIRANPETLRTRLGDTEDLREGPEALCTRIREVEECITVHHVHEYMRRIILIESRIGGSDGLRSEILRQCQVRFEQCAADLTDLRDRMRTQNWYHDLSEQESDDEIQRMLDRAENEHDNGTENRPVRNNRRRHRLTVQQRRTARAMSGRAPRELTEVEIEQMQSQENSQTPEAHEGAIQQRLRRLAESQRQSAEDLNHLDSKINQFRHDFRESMAESALTIQRVMQEVRGRGQRLDRLSHVGYHVVVDKLEGVDFRFQQSGKVMDKVLTETDHRSRDMCTSIGHFINEQMTFGKW